MRLIRALLSALLLTVPGLPALAQALQIAPDQALVAAFRQERHLDGFDTAITSSGQFFLLPEQGVVWSTRDPFENHLVIGRRKITQIVQGEVSMQIPASRMPGAKSLSTVFAAVLTGDWNTLEKDFGAVRSGSAGNWSLTYEPKGAGPALKVTLAGGRFVETAEIERENGDRDRIVFSRHDVRQADTLGDVAGLFP